MTEGINESIKQRATVGGFVKREFAAQGMITTLTALSVEPTVKPAVKTTLNSVVAELENAKNEYDAMNDALESKTRELAQKRVLLDAATIEVENQRAAYANAQSELLQWKEECEKLKKNKTVTYSTKDISTFLNETIREFNEKHTSDSEVAQYVINSMDVDLKVRVFDDSQNDKENPIKFVAPSATETSEDSLSSIKISIQAVPKVK